jgi:hypothetical protein
MVVQQGRPIRLAGQAAPGEAVTATFGAASAATKADAAGRWSLALPAFAAGGPYALKIEGAMVVLSSPDVPEPIAVRYAWGDDPPNTLRNQADLPAVHFRSDDWPTITATAH